MTTLVTGSSHHTDEPTNPVGAAAAPTENPLAVAGGVIGTLALLTAVTFGWWLPFVVPALAVVGLALSHEGLRRVREDDWPDRTWAVVGVATGAPALLLGLLGTFSQYSTLIVL